MAAFGLSQESFEVNVKDFHGSSVVIKVLPEWNVGMVKQEIASRTSIDPRDFRIVFAGQTLEDAARLWVCAGRDTCTCGVQVYCGMCVSKCVSMRKIGCT